MAKVYVAHASEIPEGERRIITHEGSEIGIFRWEGRFYAYENLCLHQGGPACEGVIMHKVEEEIAPDRRFRGLRFSADEVHFVCPWHGYEYDLKTGECAGDRRLRLKSYKVAQRADEVYIITD